MVKWIKFVLFCLIKKNRALVTVARNLVLIYCGIHGLHISTILLDIGKNHTIFGWAPLIKLNIRLEKNISIDMIIKYLKD